MAWIFWKEKSVAGRITARIGVRFMVQWIAEKSIEYSLSRRHRRLPETAFLVSGHRIRSPPLWELSLLKRAAAAAGGSRK